MKSHAELHALSGDLKVCDLHPVRAILVGALVGALCPVAYWLVVVLGTVLMSGDFSALSMDGILAALAMPLIAFLYGYVGWLAGLIILGIPGWLLLHHSGFRGLAPALAFGACTPTVVVVGLALLVVPNIATDTTLALAVLAVAVAAIGALVGATIWTMSYGRHRSQA